jgi:hypothetical protein
LNAPFALCEQITMPKKRAMLKLFPVERSWTTGWSNLRDTLRGQAPRGESRYAPKEKAIY